MDREAMDGALHEVRAGTMTFDAFTRRTMERWRKIAAKLLRRWDVPTWMPVEDVVQDLLFAAWWMIPRWDESKGRTLEDFVVWNARDKARKSIHRARLGKRMHRDEDHTRSRYERPASSFARPGDDSDEAPAFVVDPAVPADQHDVVEVRRAFREARERASSVPELLAVQAIEAAGGDVESAASMLYEDVEARLLCRIGSEQKAYRVAADAAKRVVGRMLLQDAAAA